MQAGSGPISSRLRAVEDELAAFALTFPETFEDNPWGHRAFKARKPIFVFLVLDSSGLAVTVKLPESNVAALDKSFCTPTGYGMGKHGWVSARFEAHENVPIELLRAWITESFRATAPKKLVEALTAGDALAPSAPVASKKKSTSAEPKESPTQESQSAPSTGRTGRAKKATSRARKTAPKPDVRAVAQRSARLASRKPGAKSAPKSSARAKRP